MKQPFRTAVLAVGLLAIASTGSHARTKSHYCAAASTTLAVGAVVGEVGDKEYAEVKQKCQAGDTIIIPNGISHVVAAMCDFDKTIVSAGRSVICVLTQVRPQR